MQKTRTLPGSTGRSVQKTTTLRSSTATLRGDPPTRKAPTSFCVLHGSRCAQKTTTTQTSTGRSLQKTRVLQSSMGRFAQQKQRLNVALWGDPCKKQGLCRALRGIPCKAQGLYGALRVGGWPRRVAVEPRRAFVFCADRAVESSFFERIAP